MNKFRFNLMPVLITIVLLLHIQNSCFAQANGDDITIGKYRTLHSDILDEDRLLYIHVPRGYENTQLDYPVLYLLYVDIYNYFADAAMITEKLGGTGEIPPMIIVGVANTNRYRDLLPVKTRNLPESGGADNYLKFLEEELIPHIDDNYRTKDFRVLAGPQAAAVFSLYALIAKPGLFNAFITENPFMNPENAEFLYPHAESFFSNQDSLRNFLYIKCETSERPPDLEYLQKLEMMLASEKPAGFRYEIEFREPSGYFIAPLPFEKALRALFTGHRLPEHFQSSSLKDIINYYKDRSKEYGFQVDPPELMLTFEGNKLLQAGASREAIAVYEYQLGLYPKSLNAMYQLGETYRGMGDFDKAEAYYEAFLEIEDRDAARIHNRHKEMERIIQSSAAYRIQQAINSNGIRAGLDTYQTIRNDPENELYFDENELNALGYRLMGAGEPESAIEIFKLNVLLYPESANVYDSLGEAYMNAGNIKKAIHNYQRSLELNPGNENAREMPEKLKKE